LTVNEGMNAEDYGMTCLCLHIEELKMI